jgi:hypothetical protein
VAVLAIPGWIGVESTPAMTAADGAFAALAALQGNAENTEAGARAAAAAAVLAVDGAICAMGVGWFIKTPLSAQLTSLL